MMFRSLQLSTILLSLTLASTCFFFGFNTALGKLHEFKIFGIVQHAHLLGRAITTRHFRNGTELPRIAVDPNYDFNFQEARLLKNERSVQRGDSFMVECTYDSTARTAPTLVRTYTITSLERLDTALHSPNNKITYSLQNQDGGLSTRDEMCLSFVMYYPKIPLIKCLSAPIYDSINKDESAIWTTLNAYNWTSPEARQTFKQKVRESSIQHQCIGAQMNPKYLEFVFHEHLPQEGYIPSSSTCP